MPAFTSKYEDIRELVLNIVVAFTFATLAVVVIAPLFGYKLDLLVSTFNDLAPQQEDEILASQAVDSGYGGYTAPSYTARSLQGPSWPQIGSRILARYPSIPEQGIPRVVCKKTRRDSATKSRNTHIRSM